jgi:hypothetical protein
MGLRALLKTMLQAPKSKPAPDDACPSDRLAVVTCHFNPCGYRRLRENYWRFRAALRGARLFTVEVSFDGRFHLPSDWQIAATDRHVLWQKESLLNYAVARLPDQYDQVAWIDADLLFLNPQWVQDTSRMLEQLPVVQLFEGCHFTTAGGAIDSHYPSVLKKRRLKSSGHGMPGGAWAARRELIERHGLYPFGVVGTGDQIFVDGAFGERNQFLTQQMPPAMVADFRHWQRGLFEDVRGQVGCTPGDVVHLFHGTRRNRRYVERNQLLRGAGFDPTADVRVSAGGLLEWASDKPALHRGVKQYFLARREDE